MVRERCGFSGDADEQRSANILKAEKTKVRTLRSGHFMVGVSVISKQTMTNFC